MINSQKKLFKKEYSFELLRIAEGDLNLSRTLKTAGFENSGRPENIIYLD